MQWRVYSFLLFSMMNRMKRRKSLYTFHILFTKVYFTRRPDIIEDIVCENSRVKIQHFSFRKFYILWIQFGLVSTCHKLTRRQSPLVRCIFILLHSDSHYILYLACFLIRTKRSAYHKCGIGTFHNFMVHLKS